MSYWWFIQGWNYFELDSESFWDPGYDFSAELIIFLKSTFNIISYYLYYTTPTSFLQHFHASFQPPRLHNTDITRSNIRKLKPGNSQDASNNGRSRDDHVTPRCRFSKSQIYFTTLEKFQNFINDVKNFEIRIE